MAVSCKKSGPNYSFKYEEKHADIYAVYVYDRDTILYIPSKYITALNSCFTVRFDETKKRAKNVNWSSSYTDFKEALRDCTRGALTDNAEGEGTVQTDKPE